MARSTRLRWFLAAAASAALCVAAGLVFDEAALWGTAAVVSVLYIGALGIFYDRQSVGSAGSGGNVQSELRTWDSWPTVGPHLSTPRASNTMTIGSPEFSSLANRLAERLDEPVDILDTARRSGLRMGSLRSGGAQTPLNLWTAVLTRAVRDARVEPLLAEIHRSDGLDIV